MLSYNYFILSSANKKIACFLPGTFNKNIYFMLEPSTSYSVTGAVGNTPLVQLRKVVPEHCADIYVKLEYFNPTGSYKDRMALAIIEEAEKKGMLRPGMTVVECTGGSTGTSLAFVCAVKGYRLKIVSSDAFAKEKLQAMRLFGAELEILPSEDGKITPGLIPKMIERVAVIAAGEGAYCTDQFNNKDAVEGYRVMGKEILKQLHKPVDVFCAAVGTAGMVTGVSKELKKANSSTKLVLLEPASAPLISKGVKGSHKVEGIGVGFVPPLLKKEDYDEVRVVEEPAGRKMAKRLAAEEGIFAGTSSGINVTAAIEIGKEMGPGYTIVTVACDSGMKYFASGLFD
jgi:cysteine synthase